MNTKSLKLTSLENEPVLNKHTEKPLESRRKNTGRKQNCEVSWNWKLSKSLLAFLRGSYLRPWPIWGWRWLRCPWCCCTGTGRRRRSLPPCPRWPWPRRGRPWPCRRCRPPARWCCTSAQQEESFRCKGGWRCGGDKLVWCAVTENICGC